MALQDSEASNSMPKFEEAYYDVLEGTLIASEADSLKLYHL